MLASRCNAINDRDSRFISKGLGRQEGSTGHVDRYPEVGMWEPISEGWPTADRQSVGGFFPVVCGAGMNPAHSWHTMLVRERGFAVGLGMHSFTSEKRVSQYRTGETSH